MARNCVLTEAAGLNSSALGELGVLLHSQFLRPFSLSSSLHKRWTQLPAWGGDLCQSRLTDKWKPPVLRWWGTLWPWEPLDKDTWASPCCPGSDPSSSPSPAAWPQLGQLVTALGHGPQGPKGEMWGQSSRHDLTWWTRGGKSCWSILVQWPLRSNIPEQCCGMMGNGIESCWTSGRSLRKGDHLSKTEHLAAACGTALKKWWVMCVGRKNYWK